MTLELLTSVLLGILATYRLAQFIALDDGPFECFVEFRGFLRFNRGGTTLRKGPIWSSLRDLVSCPYCLGVWFAGLMTLLISQIAPLDIWTGILVWLGIAGGQAALETLTSTER